MPPPRGTLYLGLDPGLSSGGLAALTTLSGRAVRVLLTPMPETETDVWDWLRVYKPGDYVYPAFAMVEWIHPAIQGVGKSSMSKLYGNYMLLRGLLVASGIPWENPKPHEWQKALGVPKRAGGEDQRAWKNRLKAHAQRLFPAEHVTLATCDALLIAEFCRRKREGKL